MSAKSAIITYCDEFHLWQHVQRDFEQRLPLRNIQYKSLKGLRTVPAIEVALVKFDASLLPKPDMYGRGTPMLHLYLVNCDDAETYRQVIRKQIREWLAIVQSRREQDWLIVYVSPQDSSRNAANKFLNMKTSVVDKIRSDFNTAKRDRCIQLRVFESSENKEAGERDSWTELITKVKDGLMFSFEQQVGHYEENLQRLDAQRMMPGWNYCQFFLLKEGLANCFQALGLYEDALIQYDELEASFFQTIHNQITSFSKFGATDAGDDSIDILTDQSHKPFRQLLIQNTITVFDFRQYLHSQQVQLLQRLQRPYEIVQRTRVLIDQLARGIDENQESLFPFFKESWTYSTGVNTLAYCDDMVKSGRVEENNMEQYVAVKGDLLAIAKNQLDKLGAVFHNIITPFVSPEYLLKASTMTSGEIKVTNTQLRDAILSLEQFDSLYTSIVQQSIKAMQTVGRSRAMLSLRTDLAIFHFCRGRYEAASETISDIMGAYTESGWLQIDNALLVKQAICLRKMGRTQEYVLSCLNLLAASTLRPDEVAVYAQELNTNATKLSEPVESDIQPLFSTTFASDEVLPSKNAVGQLEFTLQINSNLPIDFPVDRVMLQLAGGETNDVWFVANRVVMSPGANYITLQWQKPCTSGNYVGEVLRIELGQLSFVQHLLKENRKYVVKVHEPYTDLHLGICPPAHIFGGSGDHGGKQVMSVFIDTRTETVHDATLTIRSALVEDDGNDVELDLTQPPTCRMTRTGDTSHAVTVDDGQRIRLPLLHASDHVIVDIPLRPKSDTAILGSNGHTGCEFKLVLEYSTQDGVSKIVSKTAELPGWQPFGVGCTLQFLGGRYVLLAEVTNHDPVPAIVDGLSVAVAGNKYRLTLINETDTSLRQTLFHGEQLTLAYHVEKIGGETEADKEPENMDLTVQLTHRFLNEDVMQWLSEYVGCYLLSVQRAEFAGVVQRVMAMLVDAECDYNGLALLGEMRVTETAESNAAAAAVAAAAGQQASGVRDELRLSVQDVVGYLNMADAGLGDLLSPHVSGLLQGMQSITLEACGKGQQRGRVLQQAVQVTMPQLHLHARLDIPQAESLAVGIQTPCTLQLSLAPVFGDANAAKRVLPCQLDVSADADDWLVAGSCQMRLDMSQQLSVALSLIPLRPGYLELPLVQVTSLAHPDAFSFAYADAGRVVAVRPSGSQSYLLVGSHVVGAYGHHRRGHAQEGRRMQSGSGVAPGSDMTAIEAATTLDTNMARFSEFGRQFA
ncbi:hypothetical protein RI367_007634 [Sorochytrium milnesiophthora]